MERYLGSFYMHDKIRIVAGHWLWTGHCDVHGRARVSIGGKNKYVSRVLWGADRGHHLRKGERITRTCEVPECVNPECWQKFRPLRKKKAEGEPPLLCPREHSGEWVQTSQGRWACKVCARERQREHYNRAKDRLA